MNSIITSVTSLAEIYFIQNPQYWHIASSPEVFLKIAVTTSSDYG